MRLVIARCSVDYVGRLDAHLPLADRLIMVKADGSLSVHADDRAYKPLNWMTPPCTIVEEPIVDVDGDETGAQLWVVENPKGEQLRVTVEEIHSDVTYDLGVDPGLIKDGVEQLTRYVEMLSRDSLLGDVKGVFAAQEIKPQAKTLAEDRGIRCVTLDYDELRGIESNELRLF